MALDINPQANLAELIDLLICKQAETEAANDVVKALKKEEEVIEAAIMIKLAEIGVDRISHSGYTAKKEEVIFPALKDFDAFTKFVHRHKYYHLFERRVATLAFRELLGIKGAVPGVEPRVVTKLSFRKNPQ